MRYSQNVIEDVRLGNDIVDVIGGYVSLKQRGHSFVGLCPFHNEKTPSFFVNSDEQLYHCFGCSAGGNVYSFVMQMENLGFVDAVKFLADRINYSLPEGNYNSVLSPNEKIKEVLLEIHKKAARFFYNMLISSDGTDAVKYLEQRGISEKVRRKYGLGFSGSFGNSLFKYLSEEGYDIEMLLKSGLILQNKNGGYYDKFYNRLMFPIIDVRGNIIAFGGRVIGNGEPKYLNSPDTPIFKKSYNMYSLNFAKKVRTRELIIVEGYMDVISLFQNGFTNVVASLGTAFNNAHASVIRKYADKVILLFDSDNAGTNATLKAIPPLLENGVRPKVLQVTGAKDPDEYIKKFGPEAFGELLKTAKSYIVFQIECERKKHNIDNIDDKILFTNKAAEILSALENKIERDAYVKEISQTTGISESAIIDEINKRTGNSAVLSAKKKYKKYDAKVNNTSRSHGVEEARRDILKIMALDKSVCKKISDFLSPEEFGDNRYSKLAEIINSLHSQNKEIRSAELVSFFDSVEEQQVVSEIFLLQKEDKDIVVAEKAINDQIILIKEYYIDHILMPTITDVAEMQKALDKKRAVKNLNITLSDG